MPHPVALQEAKQLVVEGRTTQIIIKSLLDDMGLTGFQVQDMGSYTNLRPFLTFMRNKRGFKKIVTSLGIIRDAENNALGAFTSVCDSLKNARIPVPSSLGVVASGPPRVGVYLFPDCSSNGMLEDLCVQSVSSDPAWPCIIDFFACLTKRGAAVSQNLAKAQVQAFLASRARPGLLLGQAAQAGYLPWNNAAFDMLKHFLHSL